MRLSLAAVGGLCAFGPVAPHFGQTPLVTRVLYQLSITNHIGRYPPKQEQSRAQCVLPKRRKLRVVRAGK